MAPDTELENVTLNSAADAAIKAPPAEDPGVWNPNSKWHRIRLTLAVLLAAVTVFYSAVWMYYIRITPPPTYIGGFESHKTTNEPYYEITRVYPGSLSARAGLQPGDRVRTINGRVPHTIEPLYTVITLGHPGQIVRLGVEKAGSHQMVEIEAPLVASQPVTQSRSEWIIHQILSSFPVLFLVVSIPVLFLRVDDRTAWLLALTFAGFIAQAPMEPMSGLMPPTLRGFSLAYLFLFDGLGAAAFYYLFAIFPARSPIDLRLPWLKHLITVLALAVSLPLAAAVFLARGLEPLWPILDRITASPLFLPLLRVFFFGVYGLGLVSLIWNHLRAQNADVRRKTAVMVWGTVLAQLPWIVMQLFAETRGKNIYDLPYWAWTSSILAVFLMPLSFAYAVLKHRVLGIPVLLRRSARYLLVQRGFLILMLLLGTIATLALSQSFSEKFPSSSAAAIPVGVAFGMVLVGGGTWAQQRVREKVDKAFFRTAYDSKQILEDVVERAREVRTRKQLSDLLESNLRAALQPTFLMVYLALRDDSAVEENTQDVSLDSKFLDDVFAHDQPFEVTADEFVGLERLRAECLVPVSGREGQRLGLLVLGPRMSEEPYSREDKRLLAVIAKQAGSTLENIQMGEEIAERMAAEKRAAHEIDLARQVQRKLFPQNPPRIANLDFAGECVQARVVGGDYYDFLELAPGLVGFALADISGKGFPAALLMANLQANLRGQYALALDDLPRLLQSVNRLFYANSEPSHYATMFFGCYYAETRRLRYVNCGHNPPLLLRANGSVEHLHSTATVMGLFPEWECAVAEISLAPGDLFAIYTDGVTEAAAPGGEEFGEERLVETLRRNRHVPAVSLLQTVIDTVQHFSPGEQGDDITVVVGKVL